MDSHRHVKLYQGDVVRSKARDADLHYPLHVRRCQRNDYFYDLATGQLAGYRFDSAWRGGPGRTTLQLAEYRAPSTV